MPARILVAYATRKGSTAEIAGVVGKELQSAGYDVVVTEMNAVKSLEGFDAFVLGAPVYMHKVIGMGKFAKRFREELAPKPVAIFAAGMAPVSNKPGEVEEETKILSASITPKNPVSVALFAGKVDPAQFNFLMRRMVEAEKSMVGDFRDWDAIAAWAKDLPEKMGL
jgi:menaquinone-dependent protoporphyrinogen oxidase